MLLNSVREPEARNLRENIGDGKRAKARAREKRENRFMSSRIGGAGRFNTIGSERESVFARDALLLLVFQMEQQQQ